MKHLMLLLVIAVVAYAAWHLTPAAARRRAMGGITYHGLRVAAIFAVIGLLAAAAFYLPSSPLLP